MSLRLWASRTSFTLAGAAMLAMGPAAFAAPQDSAPAGDNTKVNKDHAVTADQQKMNTQDRDLTRQIRKAIIADKTLSTYGHNVKIITVHGSVTLRGPVRSDDEKASIESKAKAVTGVSDVKNELTVVPKKG